jgi:sirohydrochlorin ferrochelatase
LAPRCRHGQDEQANWLSEELTKAVGDPVQVKPVLALPGWYVERTAPPEMLVLNGKSPQAILSKYPPVLEPKMIQRIAHQVEQKCRDVKPRAYREWDN